MNNLVIGDLPTKAMAAMGLNLLPPWVTWLWLVALAAVLIFHCGHFVRMGGEHRWFHASHLLMLVSMLYMYAGMEYKWRWFPASWWVVIFCLASAAMAGWMILRLVQRRPFSFLWSLALIMQVAMIYMWMPSWAPALTWTMVVYYCVETVAWLGGLIDDSTPQLTGAPVSSLVVDPALSNSPGATPGVAVGLLNVSKPAQAYLRLGHSSPTARVSMAVMASSMAYMFAAMQLMR